MILRVARHTSSLQPIIDFYTSLLGFEVLGSFKNHSNYDGVFIGIPGESWHLEFTISNEAPQHTPDVDDLLVFYAASYEAYAKILQHAVELQVQQVTAKNPYWQSNATTLLDPDGYRVVVTMQKAGKFICRPFL